jgi:MFS transporter, NHS family, xanthosine permease
MSIKLRLTVLSFLQFFVWGAWLTTIGTYCGNEGRGWKIEEFGAVFSTLAIASIFMPPIIGIIADKFINSERLYGAMHILYGAVLLYVPQVNDPNTLFYVMLVAMCFYMPTISLSNSLSYTILKRENFQVIDVFPKIRTFGTIGFIVAMWVTNLTGSKATANQFIIGGIGAILLGIYAFTLPKCPPQNVIDDKAPLYERLGFKAFTLFKKYKMAVFFVFAMLLGAALQLTNMYADWFLTSFDKNSVVSKYSTIIVSISQISETLFILSIPFFLKRFGIKNVMLFSMLAWVLRFGLFAYGGDSGLGFMAIIISCIVYGLAFDFFNISGSLFIETNTNADIRGSAQGIFMMMSNGIGAYFGSIISTWAIGKYFSLPGGNVQWSGAWMTFAIYALIVAFLFYIFFKHKHNPKDVENIAH